MYLRLGLGLGLYIEIVENTQVTSYDVNVQNICTHALFATCVNCVE